MGGVDQGNVGECLGEVPDKALCFRIILLRQQAQIVPQRE
jgi:hypothetical protein